MLISILSYSEHFEKQARNSKASDFRSFVTIACTFRNLLRSREVTINLKCDKNKYPGEMDGISIRGTTAVSSIVSLYGFVDKSSSLDVRRLFLSSLCLSFF